MNFMKLRFNIEDFVIFSDDIEWCKHFLIMKLQSFMDQMKKTDLDTLLLFAQHQYFIISNSSFSWWAVELSSIMYNAKPNVCSPAKWSNQSSAQDQTLIKNEWHVIGTEYG